MSDDRELIEVRLGDQVLAFDGRVVEEFGGGRKDSERRLHVALIEKIEAKAVGSRASLKINGGGSARIIWAGKADPETLERLQELVAAIRAATGLEVSA
ncbi:MAG: hypothetical protein WB771_01930 [Solirubrobacterales bacterium]